MLDLNYHNSLRYEMYTKPVNNAAGVACPKCGSEMQYTDSGMLLLSDPPKMSVRCACGHNDYNVC